MIMDVVVWTIWKTRNEIMLAGYITNKKEVDEINIFWLGNGFWEDQGGLLHLHILDLEPYHSN